MVERILEAARQSSYDFRETACPDDPLRHLFPEWVEYYRLKWAVARVLQPKTLLEVGVRFGYSARSFLDACPSSEYVGIDLDADTFGGSRGAIEWARKICQPYQAQFLIANSVGMKQFPGGPCDLIHVDGQQDEEGTAHDLTLALSQAKYVLVDGYFWSRQNFMGISELLNRHRAAIEFYEVIPGYAGELLIKTHPQRASIPPGPARSSAALRHEYTRAYYLSECGGYDAFKRTGGLKLQDDRLISIAQIASLAPVGRALDLGCGRGELSIELARRGFQVTAVDYSPDAVALVSEVLASAPDLSSRVSLECADLNQAELTGSYELAVASDLVEHLAPDELETLYNRMAEHLAPGGLFVADAFPNLWSYRFDYARRRRVAARIGAYLPAEPRSRYELLMHINEQSPPVFLKQLKRHFRFVVLWFGSPSEPGEGLRRKPALAEMRSSPGLFVVASNSPIPIEQISARLSMMPLKSVPHNAIELSIANPPSLMSAGTVYRLSITVRNNTGHELKSVSPYPVHLSYRWLGASGECIVRDGERTRLQPPLLPGAFESYGVHVKSPETPGDYKLRATLVQENVRWFDSPPSQVYCDVSILCVRL